MGYVGIMAKLFWKDGDDVAFSSRLSPARMSGLSADVGNARTYKWIIMNNHWPNNKGPALALNSSKYIWYDPFHLRFSRDCLSTHCQSSLVINTYILYILDGIGHMVTICHHSAQTRTVVHLCARTNRGRGNWKATETSTTSNITIPLFKKQQGFQHM